jgi:hypothetical protein
VSVSYTHKCRERERERWIGEGGGQDVEWVCDDLNIAVPLELVLLRAELNDEGMRECESE